MRVSVWVGIVLCVLVGMVQSVAVAQTPLAQPDLDLWSGGIVYTMVGTADGGRIIGGEFTAVGGLPRRNLARLLADGSVDPAWSADVNGPVQHLAVDADGRIYVAGSFSQLGGIPVSQLGRLSAGGQPDVAWVPAPSGGAFGAAISALLVAGPHLYVGGDFSQIGGQSRAGLARFNTVTGALDLSWSPPPWWGGVTQLAADTTHLYVATAAANGFPLIRYPLAGPANQDAGWIPNVNSGVDAIVLDGAGSLYVAGGFTVVQGTSHTGLARLSTAGGAAVDSQWAPTVLGWVGSLRLSGAHVYLAGRFRTSPGQAWSYLSRYAVAGNGTPDAGFAPAVGGGSALVLLSGGIDSMHVGGRFTSISGQSRPALATVSLANGQPTPLATAAEQRLAQVYALMRQTDGGLLVGGRFTRVGTLPRLNLLRLGPDGSPDPSWRVDVDGPPVPYRGAPGDFQFENDPSVAALAQDAEGRVYVGGGFAHVGGQLRANLARLSADGLVDADWNPGANGSVSDLLPDNLGNVYAAGNFTVISGAMRVSLAKLSAAAGATIDPLWRADLDLGSIAAQLLLDGQDSLFVAGNGFASVNGVDCCEGLIKLSASGVGALDPTWSVRATGSGRRVHAIALRGGLLYVAGRFDALFQGGISHDRNSLARVDAQGSGAVDTLWNPSSGMGIGHEISSLAVDSDRVYVSPYYQANRLVSSYSLAGTGEADASWLVSGANYVYTLLASGGRLYAGGNISAANGQPRHGLVALETGALLVDGFE